MRIAEIWRYPVKSMLGEPLEQARVGPGGIQGDRRWAVVDVQSGVSLSAKRYADLLNCRARTRDGEVMIELPDGRELAAGSSEVASALSELLERKVTTRAAGATETIRHEFPTAVTEGEGEPFVHEPGTESFFDSATLHLLTTATLAELQRLLPDSEIHQARFRPNILVETGETGFIENGWLHKEITLGPLRCQVIDNTQRCVMVTRSQGRLPRDIQVIRTIFKRNGGNAGVALQAQASGSVRCGDEVSVLD